MGARALWSAKIVEVYGNARDCFFGNLIKV